MNDDDDLLDEITEYLRTEPLPEMPKTLAPRLASRPHGWVWMAAVAGALAASLGGFLLWRSQPLPAPDPQSSPLAQHAPMATDESGIVVLDMDMKEPLGRLEGRLDLLEMEIAELRKQATLLDARRKADALLAQY